MGYIIIGLVLLVLSFAYLSYILKKELENQKYRCNSLNKENYSLHCDNNELKNKNNILQDDYNRLANLFENLQYRYAVLLESNQGKDKEIKFCLITEEEEQFNKFKEKCLLLDNDDEISYKDYMNSDELTIYYSLISVCNDYFKDYKYIISPQVSMKAFVKGDQESESWKAYSSFVVDFLIGIKKYSGNPAKLKAYPYAVIEYHGHGHYFLEKDSVEEQKRKKLTVSRNDFLKEKCLTKVGIPLKVIKYDEIYDDDKKLNRDKLKQKIKQIFDDIIQVA
ncbi:MAG: DUF2726 domain-containing protein [Neisseriaceae bacterium]|nr:DUF2726 domain-containing protein [Neisseriaceae bacterium]